jgi:hypothetical protein
MPARVGVAIRAELVAKRAQGARAGPSAEQVVRQAKRGRAASVARREKAPAEPAAKEASESVAKAAASVAKAAKARARSPRPTMESSSRVAGVIAAKPAAHGARPAFGSLSCSLVHSFVDGACAP